MSPQGTKCDKRVCFDFEIDFSNGGGIQGQDFRLDIDGVQAALHSGRPLPNSPESHRAAVAPAR